MEDYGKKERNEGLEQKLEACPKYKLHVFFVLFCNLKICLGGEFFLREVEGQIRR